MNVFLLVVALAAPVEAPKAGLTGPWSVTRRLNAARIRGDTEEVERLTTLLERAVEEALETEGAEP